MTRERLAPRTCAAEVDDIAALDRELHRNMLQIKDSQSLLQVLVASPPPSNIPTPLKMELGEGGDPWNSIYGAIFPFVGKGT